ncbi:MAG: PAS domain S-box protein [Methanoregula sp.]|nr:PAS domain S-box protein [Methanoregula sp.]
MIRKIRWWHLVALLIILVGICIVVWSAKEQGAAQQNELLTKTRLAGTGILAGDIIRLSGSSADLTSPEYITLKNHLNQVRQSEPNIRFAYLMGQKNDGTVFFYADSEDPTSGDYSPPGQVYTEVSADARSVFSNGNAVTVGPVTDRWGTWVSGYVPVIDPTTGKVVAVFGMDVDASAWYWEIISHGLPSLAAILLILILFAAFVVFDERSQNEKRRIAASEESLREKEAFQRALLDNLTAGVVIVDAKTHRIDLVNPTAAALFGAPLDQIIGKKCNRFLCPAFEGACPVIDLSQDVNYAERIMLRSDGTQIPILKSVKRITLGGQEKLLENFIDITERKWVEKALMESTEKYRLVVDNANEAILVAQDGIAKLVNRMTAELTGYPEEELTSKPFAGFIHPADREMVVENYSRRLRGENLPARYQFRVLRKDGDVRWVEIGAVRIAWEGRPASLNFLTDITKRKKFETALFESTEKYRLLVENASEIIAVVQDGMFKFVNKKGIELTGYSLAELMARPSLEFVYPADRDLVIHHHQSRLQKETELDHFPARIIIQDGSIRWFEIKGVQITWEDQPAVLYFYTDITRRKQAEIAVQAANKKLNMLSSVTRHDILNQLMGLRTFLELSREDTKDPTLLGYIEKEDQAAEAIQWQIEFTRDFEDIGTKEPTWQDVAAAVGVAKTELKGMPGVEVDIRISGLEVFADAPFEKVFFNLMENSVRHGEHVTRIALSLRETETGFVIVYEDNGIGIPEEDKKKLFRKGFGKHTGLGLFLSREILSITGITITENGVTGEGARFEITVPKGVYRFSRAKAA